MRSALDYVVRFSHLFWCALRPHLLHICISRAVVSWSTINYFYCSGTLQHYPRTFRLQLQQTQKQCISNNFCKLIHRIMKYFAWEFFNDTPKYPSCAPLAIAQTWSFYVFHMIIFACWNFECNIFYFSLCFHVITTMTIIITLTTTTMTMTIMMKERYNVTKNFNTTQHHITFRIRLSINTRVEAWFKHDINVSLCTTSRFSTIQWQQCLCWC